MRVLVCGGRDFKDRALLYATLDRLNAEHPITTLINGQAPGADSMADKWAELKGIWRYPFPADWDRHGRAAGPIRNAQMLKEGRPDLVVAFAGNSGTQDMIDKARAAGVKLLIVE